MALHGGESWEVQAFGRNSEFCQWANPCSLPVNAPVNAIPNAMSIGVRRFEYLALICTLRTQPTVRSSRGGQSLESKALGCREGPKVRRQVTKSQNRSLLATNVPWAACEKLALEEFLGWTLGARPRSKATARGFASGSCGSVK